MNKEDLREYNTTYARIRYSADEEYRTRRKMAAKVGMQKKRERVRAEKMLAGVDELRKAVKTMDDSELSFYLAKHYYLRNVNE